MERLRETTISLDEKKNWLKLYWKNYSRECNVTEKDTEMYFNRVEKEPEIMWMEAMESWYFGEDASRIIKGMRSARKTGYDILYLRYCGYGNKLKDLGEDLEAVEAKFLDYVKRNLGTLLGADNIVLENGEIDKADLLRLYWLSYSANCNVSTKANNGYLKLVRDDPELMWKEAFTSWILGKDATEIINRIERCYGYLSSVKIILSAGLENISSHSLESIEPVFKAHVLGQVWQSIGILKEHGVTHIFNKPLSMFSPLPDTVFDMKDKANLPNVDKKAILSIYLMDYCKHTDISVDEVSAYFNLINSVPDVMWDEAVYSYHCQNNLQTFLDVLRQGSEAVAGYLSNCRTALAALKNKGVVETEFAMSALNNGVRKKNDPWVKVFDCLALLDDELLREKCSASSYFACWQVARQVGEEGRNSLANVLNLYKKNLLKLYWPIYAQNCNVSLRETADYYRNVDFMPGKMWQEALNSFCNGEDASEFVLAMRDTKNPSRVREHIDKSCSNLNVRTDEEELERGFIQHIVAESITSVVEDINKVDENSKKYGKTYKCPTKINIYELTPKVTS